MSFPFSRTVGAGTHIVSLSDINILCDTSAGAVNIILPKISDAVNFSKKQGNGIGGFGSGNFTLNISDISNNASVNNIVITKNSSDSFANNLSSISIDKNNGSVALKPISESLWNISVAYSGGLPNNMGNLAINQSLEAESSLIREYSQGSFVKYPLNIFSDDQETIVGYIKVSANTYKIGDVFEGKVGLLNVRYGINGSGRLNFYLNENLAFSKETLVNSFDISGTDSGNLSGIGTNYGSNLIKFLTKDEIVGSILNLKSNPINYNLLPTKFFDITKDIYFVVTAQCKTKEKDQFALLDITLNKVRNAV